MKTLNFIALVLALVAFVALIMKALGQSFPYEQFLIPFSLVVLVFSVAVYKAITPNTLINENFRMFGIMSAAICTFVITGDLLLKLYQIL